MSIPPFGTPPLPAQSGNSGKFLTTNGSKASWASASSTPRFTRSETFENLATANTLVTGTGAVVKAVSDTRLNSGATAASTASVDTYQDAFNFQGVFNRNPTYWIQGFMAGPLASQTYTTYMTFGWLGDGGNNPIQSGAIYFGFKYVATLGTGVLSSCHGDGTHSEVLTTITGIDVTNYNVFFANMTSGSKIDFYVNGTLKTTHNTNLPSGTQLFSSATSQTFRRTAGTTSMTVLDFTQLGYSFDAF